MPAIEVGRFAVKLAGRDAGRECIIVEVLDKNFVMIDGNTRRRKCNIDHLELLGQTVDIKAKASHEDVVKALEKLGIKVIPKAPSRKKKGEKEEAPKKPEKRGFLAKLTKAKAPKKPAPKEEKKEPKKAPAKKPAKKPAAKKTSKTTKKPAKKTTKKK